MTHLKQIKQSLYKAIERINDYESTVGFMRGLSGDAPARMIVESREAMADALVEAHQQIDAAIHVAPTPTGSDNVVTIAEQWHS